MSRMRFIIPIFVSSLAGPALGGDYSTSFCRSSFDASPRCEAERTREFAAQRNAEIERAIAAVEAYRAELAMLKTHCKSPDSTTPRCEAERSHELAMLKTHCKTADSMTPRCVAERTREFAAARNAEINASIATVTRVRELALARTHCKTADSTTPRCEAERARQFADLRNAEIDASIAAVTAERERQFAAARNAEIKASLAAYEAEREHAFKVARNAEINASMEMVAFVRERNAEINASLAAAKAARARTFAAARNAEINASMAAVKAERERQFAAARNAEITASLAAVEAARTQMVAWNTTHCNGAGATPRCLAAYEHKFAAAQKARADAAQRALSLHRARSFEAQRNAEINASLAAYYAERALRVAMRERRHELGMETGALPRVGPTRTEKHSALNRTLYSDPCRAAGAPVTPLQFSSSSVTITEDMKPVLDRIAAVATLCPAVRIELQGHADASAPAHINRNLASRRAQVVLDYLAAAGVERSRLTAIGYGASRPLVDTQTDIRNARVEVRIDDPALHSTAMAVMRDLAELLDPSYTPMVARLEP